MAQQLEKREITINNIRIIKDAKHWSKRDALLPPALSQTEYFRLDDRSMSDMVEFTKKLVKLIRYYDLSDNEIGNWSGFLKNIDPKNTPEHAELIKKLARNNLLKEDATKLPPELKPGPHEVLFLAFLSLMRYPQEQINRFSSRYLEYYYQDYLEFRKKPTIPAKGHVVFELNKGAPNVLLEKGTLLNAGEDSERKKISYETAKNLLVTSAHLTTVQTLSGISENSEGLILTTIFNKANDKSFTPKAFKTFGEQQGNKVELGFAISSSILTSSAGTRILTLTFALDKEVAIQKGEEFFAFYISGEKQWIELKAELVATNENSASKTNTKTKSKNLIFKFALTESISSPEQYEPGIYFNNNYPILKAVLKDFKKYKDLQNLKVTNIGLELKADNVSGLKMANDEMAINPNTRLIYPFGLQPITGSSFYFTHADLMGKELSELKLEMKWLGLPTEKSDNKDVFADYYKAYNHEPKIDINSFQSSVKFCTKGKSLLENTVNLFSTTGTSNLLIVASDNTSNQRPLIESTGISSDNPNDWPEYFMLSLKQDFLHSIYPKIFAEAATKSGEKAFPNPPYTPVCSSITVSYTATATIDVEEASQFKHLCPLPIKQEATIIPNYSDLGYLFLGISDLERGKPLTMLWQAASGSVSDNSKVRWEYWSENGSWKDFADRNQSNEAKEMNFTSSIEDTTGDLNASGIITFQIPEDISNKHTTIQSSQYWIRAVLDATNRHKPKILDTLDIKLHSVVASFDKQNQIRDDLGILKPGSIKSLVKENPNIKKLLQPYPGFDGKAAENDQQYLVRSSARLKHKNRAMTAWDYERLILAEFLEVHMVKAKPSRPGEVSIEIIIDTPSNTSIDVALASNPLLHKIKDYLQKYKSAGIELVVKNAEVAEINLKITVAFVKDTPEFREKLAQDIKWFLSPWGNSNAIDQSNNQSNNIYLSEIMNFIKTKDYIELVQDIEILPN